MPRKKIQYFKNIPYHVVNRTNKKEWFDIPIEEVWKIFCDYLYQSVIYYRANIHCFVLMDNHYHLVLSTPEGNISDIMERLQSNVSLSINKKLGTGNRIFGGRYKWTSIENPYHFANVVKYVYRNPVTAGKSSQVEDYDYSSLAHFLGKAPAQFPLLMAPPEMQSSLPRQAEELLKWLNVDFREIHKNALKLGLQKTTFKVCTRYLKNPIRNIDSLLV